MSSISGFLILALLLDGGATDASTELVRRRFQKWEELRLVDALVVRVLGADALGVQVVHDRVVERLHAELLAGLDRRGHLMRLALADEIRDGRRAHHDLEPGHAPALVD